VLVAALGVTGCASAARTLPAAAPAAQTGPVAQAPPPLPETAPAPPAPVETSPPVAVALPSIDVTSDLESLHLGPDGALQAPVDFQQVGWYADGPSPGDVGPAVLAGHVDSKSGPAVFYRLRDLRRGDQAIVTRADGQRVTFVVDRTQRFAKDAFPAAEVYAPTAVPELRLITCTGVFNSGSGHYLDNLVVWAHLLD